ncbi:hypothetical protein J1N35_002241 [Gossypium stocksii]|uniref:RNase H type-1 domain-containing protein n=1 Tax=Gossypium stocksii TaxID=47602 RepID=A0A9D4AN65_9ROSI|nr:hypothetical protein J1N35_002241 [Gossypium stocksii]
MAIGKFSLHESYKHLCCPISSNQLKDDQVIWKMKIPQRPLDSGWFKINIDGSESKNNTKAAIERAVQSSDGEWLMGFNMVTGMDEIFKIEAQAIVEGMKLAWLKGYK